MQNSLSLIQVFPFKILPQVSYIKYLCIECYNSSNLANGTYVDKKPVLANHIILLKADNIIHLGDSPHFLRLTGYSKENKIWI